MAQLKDTTIQGSARVTDTLYSNAVQAKIFNIPTSSGGTTYGPGTSGYVIKSNGTSVYWGSTGSGSVTSVQVQASSPLQSSTSTAQTQTLNTTISFTNQSPNTVLAGPGSGSSTAAPTFRALVAADIPDLNWSKITAGKPTTLSGYGITDAASSTHTQAVNKGGTNITSYTTGDMIYASGSSTLSKLTGNTTTTVKYLKSVATTSGTAVAPVWAQIAAADISGLGAAATKAVTDNSSNADVTSTDTNLITGRTLYYQLAKKGYTTNTGTVTSVTLTSGSGITVSDSGTAITGSGSRTISITGMNTGSGSTSKCLTEKGTWASFTNNAGTVTSVQVQASDPLSSSTSTAQSSTLSTTISFSNQDPNKVLAGPSSGSSAGAPSFRALVAADIPNLSWNKITSDKPTTVAGYGITDAVSTSALSDYLALAGGTMTGTITLNNGVAMNTADEAGWSMNQYGNLTHRRTNENDYLGIVGSVGDAIRFYYDTGEAKANTMTCTTAQPQCIEIRGMSSSAGHGGFIDFHYNNSSADYTSRIIEGASGQLTVSGALAVNSTLQTLGGAFILRGSATPQIYLRNASNQELSSIWASGGRIYLRERPSAGSNYYTDIVFPAAYSSQNGNKYVYTSDNFSLSGTTLTITPPS